MVEVLGSNSEVSVDPVQKLHVLHRDPVSVKYALVKENILAHPSPTFLSISSAKYDIGFFDGTWEGLFDDTVEEAFDGLEDGSSDEVPDGFDDGSALRRRDGTSDGTNDKWVGLNDDR